MRKIGCLIAGVVCLTSVAFADNKPKAAQGMLTPQTGKLAPPIVFAQDVVGENPCATLTPAAIQASIDRMDQARAEAQLEYDAFFSAGAYPSATHDGLTYITQALGQMVSLQSWLHNTGIDTPFVSNGGGGYNTHWYARSAAGTLAYGEHWSAISAVYNHGVHGKAAAELAAQATALLADIGANGLSCYMRVYFP